MMVAATESDVLRGCQLIPALYAASDAAVKRFEMPSMRTPKAHKMNAPAAIASACHFALRLRKSSTNPTRDTNSAPTRMPTIWRVQVCWPGVSNWRAVTVTRTATKNPMQIAIPPARGMGAVLTRRASGWSTAPRSSDHR